MKNKAINWVTIYPSEKIRFKPEKTHFFLRILCSFRIYLLFNFIFEILSLKQQQLFKGFAIFGTLGFI
ncbi:hypothetical protein BpHYR1_013791 [Brachionus plicatilis]|uniref:Uncharacterized protein n=1 Tax=Brachionus plicatilis TaxID=10195 RepID=A0A3M7S7I7_BRAPC|nr:hypothetical protein BpHYR1_013791 [Brachionus plicatilis]